MRQKLRARQLCVAPSSLLIATRRPIPIDRRLGVESVALVAGIANASLIPTEYRTPRVATPAGRQTFVPASSLVGGSSRGHDNEDAVSPVDTTMHVALIEPSDQRWRDTLAMIRHDFYHLTEYVSLESGRLGGTVVAAYVEQPGVRFVLPLIRRAIPGSGAFDLVSPYGYPSPIAQFNTSH
jgi:hypothetical protein